MRFALRDARGRMLLLGGFLLLIILMAAAVFAGHWRDGEKPEPTLSGEYFSRADAWTALGGTWAANTSLIQNTSEERGAKLIARAQNWKDVRVEADLQIEEPFGEAGLVVRSSSEEEGVDAYHGYFAGVRTMDSSIELGRADFGWRSMAHLRLPRMPTCMDGFTCTWWRSGAGWDFRSSCPTAGLHHRW